MRSLVNDSTLAMSDRCSNQTSQRLLEITDKVDKVIHTVGERMSNLQLIYLILMSSCFTNTTLMASPTECLNFLTDAIASPKKSMKGLNTRLGL